LQRKKRERKKKSHHAQARVASLQDTIEIEENSEVIIEATDMSIQKQVLTATTR
jgi:hypothetical protein